MGKSTRTLCRETKMEYINNFIFKLLKIKDLEKQQIERVNMGYFKRIDKLINYINSVALGEQDNKPLTKKQKERLNYPEIFDKTLKKKIRNRDNYICQLCHRKENKTRRHAVHHIDYDKDNCYEGNLITLCQYCHAKTNHNDREHWKKIFRLIMNMKTINPSSLPSSQ